MHDRDVQPYRALDFSGADVSASCSENPYSTSSFFLVPSSHLWLKYRPPPDRSETDFLLDVRKSSYHPFAASIVHYKLEYCNSLSLYYNLLKSQINRLQHIQNCLARTVVKAPKSSHITPILRSLHWLKMNERIEYKCVLLFCACCYFVVYICTWTLFSLYARPYVFTFYV